MKNTSQVKHMKIAKILMTILGLWPLNLTGFNQKLYNTYFYCSFSYYILYDISQGAKAVMMANSDFAGFVINLGITIVYVINIYKMIIFRSKPIKFLINQIEERENLILRCDDENVKNIYLVYAKKASNSVVTYVCIGSIGISLYFLTPIVNNNLITSDDNVANVTKERILIFSSWFPFDEQKHYWTAYFLQFVAGFYGYAYIVYAGAFLFSILIFGVGQLRILQHFFRNFHIYVDQCAIRNRISNDVAQKIVIKACIREHQKIIKFIKTLDASMRTFMLLDFCISSFQLSLIVFQIIQTSGINIERIGAFFFLATLTLQLFFYYWNAHEIFIQSTNVANAVFESEWFTFNNYVKECFVIIIRRAQKPLTLKIGPLYDMKVDALVNIFKTIYSYLCLILRGA